MSSQRIFLALLFVTLASTIFGQANPKIECKTPDCEILSGRNSIPNNYLKYCKSEDLVPFVIAQKEGYKTRSAILDIKSDTFSIPALKKLPIGDSTYKSIRILSIGSDNEIGDVLGRWFASPALEIRNIDKGDIVTDYRYVIEPEQFGELIEDVVEKIGLVDEGESILSSNYSIIYLNADLKKIVFNKITQNRSEYGTIELHIDWSFESPYSDKQEHFSTVSSSDPLNIDRSRASYNNMLRDAIEYGLIDLLENENANELLKLDLEQTKGRKNALTTIKKIENNGEKLREKLKTVVRVHTADDVVSSGTIISSDGYIITDFSVVSSNDSIITVEIDSFDYTARLVAQAEFYNLALLKIDAKNLRPVSISTNNDVQLTDKIYALSYSKIKLLNAYATSGRISGIRTLFDTEYYQTDLPLSNGNNGGHVVNDKLECVGIINRKVNSYIVEGIGFITPIQTVLEALNIELTSN